MSDGLLVLLGSSALAFALRDNPSRAQDAGAYGAAVASLFGLLPAGRVLLTGRPDTLSLP